MGKVKRYLLWTEILDGATLQEEKVLRSLREGLRRMPEDFVKPDVAIVDWNYQLSLKDFSSESTPYSQTEDGTYHTVQGMEVKVKVFPFFPLVVINEEVTLQRAINIMRMNRDIERCGGIAPRSATSIPEAPLSVLLQMGLRKSMMEKHGSFPHLGQIYDVVPDKGRYLVFSEQESEIPFRELVFTPTLVRSLIRQLAASCAMLQENGFNHGNPKFECLSFHYAPLAYLFQGHVISGEILLRYQDLRASSASFDHHHYFPAHPSLRVHQSELHFNPLQMSRNDAPLCDKLPYTKSCGAKTLVYKFTDKTCDIYNVIRHGGMSLYSSSFDFYSFLIQLMCREEFRNVVFNDESLALMWFNMWITPEDGDVMTERVLNSRASFAGVSLRCDIARYVLHISEQ